MEIHIPILVIDLAGSLLLGALAYEQIDKDHANAAGVGLLVSSVMLVIALGGSLSGGFLSFVGAIDNEFATWIAGTLAGSPLAFAGYKVIIFFRR